MREIVRDRTTSGFAIIAISPVDNVVQRMQIAILIIKIHYIFRSFFTIYRVLRRTLYN